MGYRAHASKGSKSKTGKGLSAAAKHAYHMRADGYSVGRDGPREDVAASGYGHMPSWAHDPADFWLASDSYERSNGTLFREFQLNLPVELNLDQQRQIIEAYCARMFDAERLPHSWAIHSPDKGNLNPHAHLMVSETMTDDFIRSASQHFMRYNSRQPEKGGAKKTRSLKPKSWLMKARAAWAEEANKGLVAAGFKPRFDHRSKAEQRDEALRFGDLRRAATLDTLVEEHEGPRIAGMRRRLEAGKVELEKLPEYAQQVIQDNNAVRSYNAAWLALVDQMSDADLAIHFADELEQINHSAHVAVYVTEQQEQVQVRIDKLRQQLAEPEPEVVGTALKLKADVERLAQELIEWRKAHPVLSWMANDDEKPVRDARRAYLASPELAQAKQARAERKQAREELSALELRLAELERAATAKPSQERNSLWDSYRETWPARDNARELDWANQKASEAARRAKIRADYLHELAAIKADLDKSPTERKAARSLAQMRRALESHALYQRIATERQALKRKHRQPGRDGYKVYLLVLSNDGHAGALAELRRQQSKPKKPSAAGNAFSAEAELFPSAPVLLPSVTYRVDLRGNVTYYADSERTKPILVDTGREVEVVDLALEAVETGLRLALQKFGPALDVHGSPEFKAAVLGVVLRTGLRVEFKDPALATELERLRGASSQPAQVPKVMPIKQKSEQEIEAEYAGEVYEGELGRGDAEMPDSLMTESEDETAVSSPSVKPPRLN